MLLLLQELLLLTSLLLRLFLLLYFWDYPSIRPTFFVTCFVPVAFFLAKIREILATKKDKIKTVIGRRNNQPRLNINVDEIFEAGISSILLKVPPTCQCYKKFFFFIDP
jgi:hypothetical protein